MHTDICAYIGVYLNTGERVYMKVYDIYTGVSVHVCRLMFVCRPYCACIAGLKSKGCGDRLVASHLALALTIGLVAVWIKALTDGTVTGATHRVPPPAFGAWKVDSDGKRR